MATIRIDVSAPHWADNDNVLDAAADEAREQYGVDADYDMSPRWEGGEEGPREAVLCDVPGDVELADADCECGEWLGEPCCWSGPESETVVVEFMPEALRESHTAARNRGVYPHNGAVRVRVERGCAELMIESDGEWCEVIDGGEE